MSQLVKAPTHGKYLDELCDSRSETGANTFNVLRWPGRKTTAQDKDAHTARMLKSTLGSIVSVGQGPS